MQIAQLRFPVAVEHNPDQMDHLIHGLLGALRMNGQICGWESSICLQDQHYLATVFIPEPHALERRHNKHAVQASYAALTEATGSRPEIAILGPALAADPICRCATSTAYILYTSYLALDSPLRCGDCFGPLPLYRLPALRNGEYFDIITWQTDYQACDTLQMNCATLERAATREMAAATSSLAVRGREICRDITQETGIPMYYYLHRGNGRSLAQERRRPCPGCGGEWRLNEPLHDLFDFRCDSCRLLSNLAGNVQRR
jgi:predicted  nucleic acid-binding Zn ribbon protein